MQIRFLEDNMSFSPITCVLIIFSGTVVRVFYGDIIHMTVDVLNDQIIN